MIDSFLSLFRSSVVFGIELILPAPFTLSGYVICTFNPLGFYRLLFCSMSLLFMFCTSGLIAVFINILMGSTSHSSIDLFLFCIFLLCKISYPSSSLISGGLSQLPTFLSANAYYLSFLASRSPAAFRLYSLLC